MAELRSAAWVVVILALVIGACGSTTDGIPASGPTVPPRDATPDDAGPDDPAPDDPAPIDPAPDDPAPDDPAPDDPAPDDPAPDDPAPDDPAPDDTRSTEAPSGGTGSDDVSAEGAGLPACGTPVLDEVGRLDQPGLEELSGLVASRRHDGVLWAHDDSGSAAAVHALDLDGRTISVHRLEGAEGRDIEDIALVGDDLVLADIGDNQRGRSSVSLLVFPEPEPGIEGPVEGFSRLRFTYPDGPTDAEALFIEPDGRAVVMAKNPQGQAASTRVYTLSLAEIIAAGPANGLEREAVAQPAGEIDLGALERASAALSPAGLLFPGAATGADLDGSGRTLAVRTYSGIWLFPVAGGDGVGALSEEPCFAGSPPELQGEAVAIAPGEEDRLLVITIGEGAGAPVNATEAAAP